MKISTEARNAAVAAIAALLDSGTIEIRTGAAPTNPSDADSGTLLAELACDTTAFGSPTGGTVTAAAITSDSAANATGTAAHFRCKDSGAAVVLQGSVGTSGADMNFDSVSFVAGAVISITSFTLTVPAS
jgi:hypothetical protein